MSLVAPDWAGWPENARPEAYRGAAGTLVKFIEPHTEAHPMALLAQFLVAAGNAIGLGAWCVAGGTRHYARLYVLIVGRSAKGRKGTALAHLRPVLNQIDEQWYTERVVSGLSSGEGILSALAGFCEKGEEGAGQLVDGRLLPIESEFASVLGASSRTGNLLSEHLRDAWDSERLRKMTVSPVSVDGAHVSLIGHITGEELNEKLNKNALFNGFANRFLFICSQRTKLLPDGGEVPQDELRLLGDEIAQTLDRARSLGEVRRSPEAQELWHEVYERLAGDRYGKVAAATNRSEAQVVRLSLVYAALSGSPVILRGHLESALAVWDYCHQSAQCLLGRPEDNAELWRILGAIEASPEGLSRTEIRDVACHGRTAQVLDASLGELVQLQLIREITVATRGRPKRVYVSTRPRAESAQSPRKDLSALSALSARRDLRAVA